MIFASLMLTMSTCISCGCNDVAISIRAKDMQEKSATVIASFNSLYDLSNYNLTIEDELTLFKSNLFNYVKNNNLLQSDYCNELEKNVIFDSNYETVMNYQCSLFNNGLAWQEIANRLIDYSFEFDENGLLNLGQNYNVLPGVNDLIRNHSIEPVLKPSGIGSNTNFEINIGGGGGGENGKDEEQKNGLPIKKTNENNASVELCGRVDGNSFIGLICSPDACINVYNNIANEVNKVLLKNTNSELTKIGEELLHILIFSVSPAAAYAAIKKSAIVSGIFNFIKDIFLTIATSGLLGKLFAVLCAVVVIGVTSAIIAMVICGYYGNGYAIGRKIKNIFNWEWVACLLYS